MTYAILTTPKGRVLLPRFPTTLTEAMALVERHRVLTQLDGEYLVSKWETAEWEQPDGYLVDCDISLAKWRFVASNAQLRFSALQACAEAGVEITSCNLLDATRLFLACPLARESGVVMLERAEDTYDTLFETRVRLGVALVCAPSELHGSLQRVALDAGYRSRR